MLIQGTSNILSKPARDWTEEEILDAAKRIIARLGITEELITKEEWKKINNAKTASTL